MQGNNSADVIATVAKAAKIDLIDGLPAMPVSGDVGDGFLCVPASVDDLGWITRVAEPARPFVLAATLRGAMQRGQAALKAYDKKNKDAGNPARMEVAQKAFAGALNGTAEIGFNDSSTVLGEALRRFKAELFPQVQASRPDKVTDDAFMDGVIADIAKNRKADYEKKVAALSDTVRSERTYAVSRKGQTETATIETNALQF